jgi:hypothetical protein
MATRIPTGYLWSNQWPRKRDFHREFSTPIMKWIYIMTVRMQLLRQFAR